MAAVESGGIPGHCAARSLQELVVFRMWSDPEPDDCVTVQSPQRSIADSNAGGVHCGFLVDLFEVEPRVVRVQPEEAIGFAG